MESAKQERRWRLLTGKPATAELDKTALYFDILANLFSSDDLITLCFQMGIDHEMLNTIPKQAFAREIILYCSRNGRLETLYHLVQEKRPFIFQQDK